MCIIASIKLFNNFLMEHSVNCFKIIFQYNSSFEQLNVVKVNVSFPENRKPLGGEWELKRHLFRLCEVFVCFGTLATNLT